MKQLNKKKPKIVVANDGLLIRNLSKSIKNKPIIRNISLNINRGEIVGLLGPNGAGKTTCFYIIMGLISADLGVVKLNGSDITNFPVYLRAQNGLGYLPQESSIFRGMTVEQNIRSVLEINESNSEKIKLMLDELLAEFSISHLRRAESISLSWGERRRVEIARALASQPSFLLLDEPLAGIDPISISEIGELVSQVKEKNVGVLVTDHNVKNLFEITDRNYVLGENTVIAEGTSRELLKSTKAIEHYFGSQFS